MRLFLFATLLFSGLNNFAQLPIVYYDFESANHNTFQNEVDMAVNPGSTAFTKKNGTITSGDGVGASILGGNNNGKSLAFYQGTTTNSTDPKQNAGNYMEFKVNTSGFKGIGIKFNVFPNSFTSPYYGIAYSTNGSSWTFGGSCGTPGTGNSFPWVNYILWGVWSNGYYNFPAAADNATNLYIRIYTYRSQSSSSSAHLRFDNIQITALSTIAGVTKTMLDDSQIYSNATSGGLLGTIGGVLDDLLDMERTKFTIDGTNTNITIPYLDLRSKQGAAGNLTISANATLSISSGDRTFYVDSAKGNVPAAAINILSGGTLKLNNTLICNGIINLAGGTLLLNNQKLQLGGTITRTTGLINATTGILELTGRKAVQALSGSFFTGKNIDKLINSNRFGINISAALNDTLRILGSVSFGNVNNSTINTGDNLTLVSTATATASVADLTNGGENSGNKIMGKANVERYVSTGRKWRFLSVATTGNQTVKQAWQENAAAGVNPNAGYGMQISDNRSNWATQGFDTYSPGGPSVKTFNSSTNNWEGITATTDMIGNFGAYMCYVRGNRSSSTANTINSTAVLRTSGTLKQGTIAPIAVPSNKNVAIGNPYASAIDMRKITKTGVQDFFYVWDPKLGGSYGLGAYQVFSKVGSNYIVTPGGGSYGAPGSVNNFIQSGQAFMMKGAAGGSVTFTEAAKVSGIETVTTAFVEDMPQALRASLYTAGTEQLITDGLRIDFGTDYSSAVDENDALKILNGSENVSVKTGNQLLSVERRGGINATDTIVLNTTGLRAQAYQWNLALDNMDVEGRVAFLLDTYTNTKTPLNLNAENTIDFTVTAVAASFAVNRFQIIFTQAIVLPVNLTGISANRNNGNTVTINWKSENEVSLDHYSVERSADGSSFTAIATTAPVAANGGSAAYMIVDNNALATVNFYRVKAVSLNGKVQYSSIVKVDGIKQVTAGAIRVYPNPVAGKKMNIAFTDQPAGDYSIELINIAGQSAFRSTITVNSNNFVKTVALGETMPGGVYTLRTIAKNGTTCTTQLIVD